MSFLESTIAQSQSLQLQGHPPASTLSTCLLPDKQSSALGESDGAGVGAVTLVNQSAACSLWGVLNAYKLVCCGGHAHTLCRVLVLACGCNTCVRCGCSFEASPAKRSSAVSKTDTPLCMQWVHACEQPCRVYCISHSWPAVQGLRTPVLHHQACSADSCQIRRQQLPVVTPTCVCTCVLLRARLCLFPGACFLVVTLTCMCVCAATALTCAASVVQTVSRLCGRQICRRQLPVVTLRFVCMCVYAAAARADVPLPWCRPYRGCAEGVGALQHQQQ